MSKQIMGVKFMLKYSTILVFVLLSVIYNLNAQEINSIYTDSTGRLFVNPKTPVYLYLSTSANGKDAIQLRSMQPEGNLLHWNNHGLHTLTHMNVYTGRNTKFDVFADGRPPKTDTGFDVKQGFQKGNTVYLSGFATIELSAIDENSGVNRINYSVNESSYQQYSKPIQFDKEGEYNIKFYSIDNVGNKEDEGERRIIVDTTPPVTNLSIQGPQHNEVIASRSRFTLLATDSNGIYQTFYSINNGKDIRYTSPINLSHLPEGEHIINWYSIDNVGNIEPKKSFNFFIDKTPPMVFEEIMGNTYMVAGKEFSSGRSQLRIVAVDNKAGVKEIFYSINKDPFKLYEKPIFLSEITGAVSVRSYAIDNVENKGTSDAEGQQFSMPEVDITGPNIRHSFIGNRLMLRDTLWISPFTKVSIAAVDNGSGVNRIEYRLNDAPAEIFSLPFTVILGGYHKVLATAWDNVENLNISNFEFGVDNKAPEIFHNFSVKPHSQFTDNDEIISVYTEGVKLFIAATDDISGVDKIFYSINESKEQLFTQPLSGFRINQTHTIKLRAIDRLGNVSEKLFRFRVE
jgi:hypothetical protein